MADTVVVVAAGLEFAEALVRRVCLVSVTPPPIHIKLSIRAQFVTWLAADGLDVGGGNPCLEIMFYKLLTIR